MKLNHLIISFIIGTFTCFSQQDAISKLNESSKTEKGKIVISNPELEYEVIIFDIGFENWLQTQARSRNYYNLSFLENKNRIWINTWNSRYRAGNPKYPYLIDYHSNISYGYEVNYLLYNYLLYWQETNNIKLN